MRDIVPRFIYVFDLGTDKMARISSLNKTTPSFKQNADLTPLHDRLYVHTIYQMPIFA